MGNMAANGYATHSPFFYSMSAVFIAEVFLTFAFLMVILEQPTIGPKGFAGLTIGLALTRST